MIIQSSKKKAVDTVHVFCVFMSCFMCYCVLTTTNKIMFFIFIFWYVCFRALKAKQADKVNTVSTKVDDMMKHMKVSPLHQQWIHHLTAQPETNLQDMLDNEIAFVQFHCITYLVI